MELQDFGLTQFEAIRLAMLTARTDQGAVAEDSTAQVEDQACRQAISSGDANPMSPLTPDELSRKAKILYRCAMADYQKRGDKWFLGTSLARQKVLTEIIARQAKAKIGEHYSSAQQEKRLPASSTPVIPSASTLPNEPSRLILSPASATSAIQPNTTRLASPALDGVEGIASITSAPDGAEIFVDSVGHGHAPALLKLIPGLDRVQLAMHGYRDYGSKAEFRGVGLL